MIVDKHVTYREASLFAIVHFINLVNQDNRVVADLDILQKDKKNVFKHSTFLPSRFLPHISRRFFTVGPHATLLEDENEVENGSQVWNIVLVPQLKHRACASTLQHR